MTTARSAAEARTLPQALTASQARRVRQAVEAPVPPTGKRPPPGPRHRRRLDHRRRVREELFVLAVFVIALAVTLFLLARQWLLNSVTATMTPAAVGLLFHPVTYS